MSLLALQRDLRAWLVAGSEDAAARLGAAAAPGLLVYQNNYRSQLVACLEESFAKTRAWLGDDAFLAACIAHIDETPPHDWTLDAYADGLPAALAARYPEDPEVAELAALELALADAFVGADADPLPAARLAGVDWDHAVLAFHPTLRTLTAVSNATDIWSALADDGTPPPARARAAPAAILVWRRGFTTTFRTTDAAEAEALRAMQAGASFGTLCATLVADLGEEAGIAAASGYLGRWIGDGLISGVVGEVEQP